VKKIILIVDDQEGNRRILRDLIEFHVESRIAKNEMPEIVEAENGLQAWNLLVNDEIKPDIIFTDYQMPKMNGLELVRKIEDELNLDSKIIICSTIFKVEIEAVERGLKFLLKPFRNDDVFKIIEDVIEK